MRRLPDFWEWLKEIIILLLFLFLFIFFIVPFSFWYNYREKRRLRNHNPYIEQHRKKVMDDLKYNGYLKWCSKNGELPMDKKGFYELRSKDKDFDSAITKILSK